MKVLLVANVLPPKDLSGAGEQVLQLAWGLREAGCEVEVLGRDRCGSNVTKPAFPWRARRAVRRVVREWRPDVVQVHESDGGLVIRDLARLDGASRPLLVALQQVSYVRERQAVRPLVDHDRDARVVARPVRSELVFRALRAPLHIALGRLTARRSDVRLAPSRATAREIEHDYGVEGVRVVPNVTGAPLDGRAGESAVPSDRDEPAAGEPYVLALGRLRIRKGMEILLHAIAQARARACGAPRRRRGGGRASRRLVRTPRPGRQRSLGGTLFAVGGGAVAAASGRPDRPLDLRGHASRRPGGDERRHPRHRVGGQRHSGGRGRW